MKQSIVERINNIIITLQAAEVFGDSLTIEEIAKRFSLSLPCVRNDIAELMNVSNKVDCGFGVMFEDDSLNYDIHELKSDIKKGMYDDKELYIYFNAVNEIAYINLDYKEYDALLKISDRFKGKFLSNKYFDKEVFKVCQDYNTYSNINRIVHAKIVSAIENGEFIKISYKRKEGVENIVIKPLRIIEYESFGKSYVITEHEDSIAAFRLDRIKGVKLEKNIKLPKTKTNNSLFEKIEYVWDMDFGGEFDVRFKVYNDNAGRVIEKVKRDLKQYVERAGYKITELEGGHIMVEGHVIGKSAFERYVRSYGASIVVFEPKEVVDDIVRSNKDKLVMYNNI
ncbi:MAG: WYL domain-containing protein [Lachnospiraceae bacterium]|nr:WYL domain-containing protein [Lachnospiraceae bacterium]